MSEPTALYRLFDKNDVLLYVGISCKPSVRFSQHKAQKSWWPDVVRKDVEWMESWGAAALAEENAIYQEDPVWNISRPRPRALAQQVPSEEQGPGTPTPSAEAMSRRLAIENSLREAVQRRRQSDEGAARARADIDRIVLGLLEQNPAWDREQLAEHAGLSPARIRAIAKQGGIPPLKPGGPGRRFMKE
jgi:predicted GIY-YIG superfamily endonuclease